MEMGKDMGEDFRISLGAKIAYATDYDIRTKPHVWRTAIQSCEAFDRIHVIPPFGLVGLLILRGFEPELAVGRLACDAQFDRLIEVCTISQAVFFQGKPLLVQTKGLATGRIV